MNIKLENISKSYGEIKVLENISLEIPAQSFTVILGASGSGKTTLLNQIAGLDIPSSGKVYFGENDVTTDSAKERDLSFVFQNYALYPHKTVFQNLSFGLKFRSLDDLKKMSEVIPEASKSPKLEGKGLRKKIIKNRVYYIAEKLKILNLLNKKPHELSGGEKQRVAIGRAIIKRPKSNLYVFDEPLSNLDARLRIKLREEIKNIHEEFKTTMVYVTHDQSEAMSMADRVVIINNGEIQQIGTPTEIYENPNNLFVAKFIGAIPMNIVSITIEEANKLLAIGKKNKLDKIVEDSKILIGIRPENVKLTSGKGKHLEGTIIHKEFQGAMTAIKVRLQNSVELYALVTGLEGNSFQIGSTVSISFDDNSLHFFNIKNGIAIN